MTHVFTPSSAKPGSTEHLLMTTVNRMLDMPSSEPLAFLASMAINFAVHRAAKAEDAAVLMTALGKYIASHADTAAENHRLNEQFREGEA